MKSKVLTIMFTDMKGFTESSGSRSRQEVLNLVARHDSLLRPILERFGGDVVKTIGDAFLVAFESPTNAVLCGLLMQATLREHNLTAAATEKIEVRVAINAGEVQLTEDDVFGEPVNIASRINAITEPGEVYFTHSVYLAMNRTEVPSSEVGERILKGIPEPIKVYRLIQDAASDQYRKVLNELRGKALEPTPEEKRSRIGTPHQRSILPWIAGVAGLAAVVAGAALLFPFGGGWAEKAREFARAGGFSQAWAVVDQRFLDAPADPAVKSLARELLEQQLTAETAGGNHERALRFLEAQRKERGWIPDLDAAIARVKKDQVSRYLKQGDEDGWAKALDVLWNIAEEKKDDPHLLLDWVAVYATYPKRWDSRVVANLDKILKLDPSLAADPRVKDTLLKTAREHLVSSSHDEAQLLWELVAKHYAEDVKAEFRPFLNNEAEIEARLYAYGILSRIAGYELPPGEVFEYQRLNLFQCVDFLSEFHKVAVKYFVDHWIGHEDASKPFTQGQRYVSIPVLEKYACEEVENALPIVAALFYEPSRPFLQDGVVQKGSVTLRYSCYRLLKGHNDISPQTLHAYHLMNLVEYDTGQFRWRYPWLDESVAYLDAAPIEDEAKRAEATQLITTKLQEIQEAMANENVQKSEELMAWLKEALEKARVRLAEGR